MHPIVRRVLIVVALLALVLIFFPKKHNVHGQIGGAFSGYCNLGAKQAITSGSRSSNYLQGIVPSCTVTVYLTGTTNLATIYKDGINTPLGNPFTANTDGSWLFFAAANQGYDVLLNGGVAPNNYTVPVTITDLYAAQNFINVLCNGVADNTSIVQLAITAALTDAGTVQFPPGTCKLTGTLSSLNAPIRILGSGQGSTTLFVTSASAIPALFDVESTTGVEIGHMTIQGASSPATLTTCLKVRYSKNIHLHDMNLVGCGYGTGANPRAGVYTENDDNVLGDNIHFTGSGGKYEWVNGYFGFPSTRIHLHKIIDDNNLAIIALTLFNCQFCTVDGGTTVNENNQTDSTTIDGYGILFYATNTSYALSSGCTGTNTITCTIPLSGGVTQLPVGAIFRVLIYGVTGGTGTLNGTWDATLLSPTTFSYISTGASATGASYSAAFAFYPTTNNVISGVHVTNTAGTCIYLQGSEYTTVTGWDCENVDQQQTGGTLPTGCIAVAGGNPFSLGYLTHGTAIGSGTCNGSGQYGIDFAATKDLTISGAISISNVGIAGIRAFGGTFGNSNYDIGGNITIDKAPECFTNVLNGVNTGSVGPLTCSNFTSAGLIPQSDNINFKSITLNVGSYLPCVDDFRTSNTYSDIVCNGGYLLLAGTSTVVSGGSVNSVTTGSHDHAVLIDGAQHLTLNSVTINGAPDGIFFINQAAQQPTDVVIKNSHIYGINSQATIWDEFPTPLTITTNSNNQVNVTTAVTITAGMGLGDYGVGGNNDIPLGTTVSSISGTCSSGCTLTISNAATGSHSNEAALLQTTMENGVKIWDTDAQCAPATVTQGFLFYGMQNLDLSRDAISVCQGQGGIDLRGQTGQLFPVTINNPQVAQVSGLAGVNMIGGNVGSAANVTINNPQFSGTGTNSIYDHSSGTGNVINLFSGTLGGLAMSITNTATTVQGPISASLTWAGATVSSCVEQTFNNFKGLQTTETVTGITPPSALSAHIWIGGLRATAASTLAVDLCSDSTGATPPNGTWTVVAR